ncbi:MULTISPECIES: DUF6493 family protein [Nocardia]|uniref:DUF6493 family protein n=1 Tax=Nocardia TaxID=1817 RepID=UPI000D6867D0|nr:MULTISPECIES: DUF6493 family protein [Nocardia]
MSVWEEMRTRIQTGNSAGVAALAARIDEAGRKEVAAALPGYLRECVPLGESDLRTMPLRVAGAGCLGGAAAVAAWLTRRDLRPRRGVDGIAPHVLRAVSPRTPAWRLDLARRLADRLRASDFDRWKPDYMFWEVIVGLYDEAEQIPKTEGIVVGWLRRHISTEPADDPLFPVMAPAIFDTDAAGEYLSRFVGADFGSAFVNPSEVMSVRVLANMKRDELLDGCLRRMLRGGKPGDLAWFVHLHESLAPSPGEAASRMRDYLRLLPAAAVAVAELAFARVRAVDESESLDTETFAEAARALLFRPERRIVKATLSWLDRTATAADRQGISIELVAGVFGHEHPEIRDRAVRIVVKRGKFADPLTAEMVRQSASVLPSTERNAIAAAYGAVEVTPIEVPVLPPVVSRELDPPIASPAELREAIIENYHGWDPAWPEVERLMAGLVTHGPAAIDELRPDIEQYGARYHPEDNDILLNALLAGAPRPVDDELESAPAPDALFRRRFREAADLLGGPALLATPTSATGHLDPEIFAARLRAWEAAGRQPGRFDLEQALLRLPLDAARVPLLDGLVSPAAATARAWISADGPGPVDLTYRIAKIKAWGPDQWDRRRADDRVTRLVVTGTRAPDPASAAARLFTPDTSREKSDIFEWSARWWPSVLPSHREVIAAHLLDQAAWWPTGEYEQDGTILALSEATGATDRATATVLLYALASQRAIDRAAALDALLCLAAQNALPAAELGHHLGVFVGTGDIVLGRVVPSLTEAVRAGAQLWPLFTAAITTLLPTPDTAPPTGLADLLAAASEAADMHRVRATIPALTAWTPKSRSTRVAKEATRLNTLLMGP